MLQKAQFILVVAIAAVACDKGNDNPGYGDYCGLGECSDEWIGDGECDQACNCAAGNWDGGDCDGSCTPSCANRVCGNDGCGGSCGACGAGASCSGNGQCVGSACTPVCSGRQCGPDECGGTCGTCGADAACSYEGLCVGLQSGSVTGSLSFEARLPSVYNDGSVVLDQLKTIPAVSMLALVFDSSGQQVLGGAQVGGDGRYVVPLASPPTGTEIVVFATLWAPSLNSDKIAFAVLRPDAGGEPQTTTSKVWSWHTTVPVDGNVGDIVITEAQGSGALFLFLISAASMETILADILYGDETRLKTIAFLWSPGVAWSCGSCFGRGYPQYVGDGSSTLEQSIWIGDDAGGSSCWGYPVILHEFGHYVAANYSRDDSPGGQHFVGSKVAAPFAWSEGWASFFAVSTFSRWAGDPRPVFWDIQQGSSFWHNYSTAVYNSGSAISAPEPQGGMTQDLDENRVSVMLWHLWDGLDVPEQPDTSDPVALGTTGVYSAIGSPRFLSYDRGATGADFVDFSDAVLCNGLAATGALVDTITNFLGFPYDGNPTCP